MKRKLAALALVLLLWGGAAGCGPRQAPGRGEEEAAPASAASAAQEEETPPAEGEPSPAEQVPREEAPGEESAPEEERQADPAAVQEPQAAPGFVKVQVGTVDLAYGAFALDGEGRLYFCPIQEEGDPFLVAEGVEDFCYTPREFFLLDREGRLLATDDLGYRQGCTFEEVVQVPQGEEGVAAANTTVLLAGGDLLTCQSGTGSWNRLEANAQTVAAGYWGMAILDREGQLWFLDRSTQELELVADGVIDCAYSDWSKTSYHNDLWYVTSDQILHREDRLGTEDRGEDYWYPRRARAVDASNGYYLAQLEDGSYLWGYGSQEGAVPVPVTGGEGSLLWLYYAILDGEGALHVGRVPPLQGDIYHAGMEPLADRIIPHPAA